MSTEVVAGLLFIVVPVAFNLAFFELGRAFDYPNILRESPDTILRKFDAGGSGLILRWEALLLSALAMLALVAVLPAVAVGAPPAIAVASIVVGTAAAVVQAIGLIRWPYAVPELARRYVAADGPDAATVRAQIETMFGTLHRLLGVGIGEHLGYLLTGTWTLLVAGAIVATADLPAWLGILGIPIGIALMVGSLEFVGPNEREGWAFAETLVPIAYIAWSVWLIVLGIVLLLP